MSHMTGSGQTAGSRTATNQFRPRANGRIWADGRPLPAELDVADWLLATTRSCRRTLDLTRPVERHVIEECLRIATQAPVSHNLQRWHWVVVTDPAKRAVIADAYRRSWEYHSRSGSRKSRRWRLASAHHAHHARNAGSAAWLPEHLAEVPVHVIPCMMGPPPDEEALEQEFQRYAARPGKPVTGPHGRYEYTAAYWASIFPAVWSFQLALRARGLGSVITCMHLAWADEVARALELPDVVTQTCMIPVAYTTRTRYRPARRAPLEQRISWNTWLGKP